MGVSDFRSLLGNRAGAQESYNFDDCDMGNGRENRFPMCCIPEKERFEEIRKLKGEFPDDYTADDEQDSCITREGASLTLEVIRARVKTDYNGPEQFNSKGGNSSKKTVRAFERQFMSEVYANKIDEKTVLGRACCDDWEIKFRDRNLPPIEYYNASMIFKLGDYLMNVTKPPNPTDFFDDFDDETEEVWIRVWYTQVYDGLVEGDLTQISDECLVHVAGELGIKNAPRVKVGKLFEYCRNKIHKRYF